MQDRFKYRFWDKKNNLMINPSEQLSNVEYTKLETMYLKDEWYITPEITLTDSLNYFDNRPFEIMQCTGLKDKNDKLIYEGDIVKISPSGFFDNDRDIFYIKFTDGYRLAYQDWQTLDTIGGFSNKLFEIIGNIYETPELLKDGE